MCNYWGYRIDTRNREYFYKEIQKGNLRQGWGFNKSQDLTLEKVDESAKRNLPILNKVKKDDILLVPRVEGWDEIAIVRAKEDFCTGYKFEIEEEIGDYGHIFPVEFIKCFSRYNANVNGDIRETMKCRSRFWNINRCGEQIEKIIATDDVLKSESSYSERLRKKVEESFDEKLFAEQLYDKLQNATNASEWEYVLCNGLEKLYPNSYSILTTSNAEEQKHGADIIIRIPGILDQSYVIAIQIKDYSGKVENDWPIDQICKADDYFINEGSKLIDKYLFIIKAEKEVNSDLIKKAADKDVKVLFEEDIKALLSQIGKAYILDTILD